MTWYEFKYLMESRGVLDTDEIGLISIEYPARGHEAEIKTERVEINPRSTPHWELRTWN